MRIRLLFLFLILSLTGQSQTLVSGSFSLPKSEKFLTVEWDFSEAVIEQKYNEAEWKALNGEDKWTEAKDETLTLIMREMNKNLSNSRLTIVTKESGLSFSYTIYVCPQKLFKNGNNLSLYILKEISSGKEIGRCVIKGKGGKFGSLSNLLGDGYEEAARKMGKYLRSQKKL